MCASQFKVTHHNTVRLPSQQGHSQVSDLHNDLLDSWQGRVPVLLVDHCHTEHGQGSSGWAGLSECVGAGGHEAEQHSIKSAAVCVTVNSAHPRGGNPTGGTSLRTTDLALRAPRRGAGELASRAEAAGGLVRPELCVRFTLLSWGGGDRVEHDFIITTPSGKDWLMNYYFHCQYCVDFS